MASLSALVAPLARKSPSELAQIDAADKALLAAQGYKQDLMRGFGAFMSFSMCLCVRARGDARGRRRARARAAGG